MRASHFDSPEAILVFLGSALLLSGCGDDGPTGPERAGARATVPQLISPAEGAILDNGCRDQDDSIEWDFDWSDIPRATQYHLFVKGDSASLPVIDSPVPESSFRLDSQGSFIVGRNRFDWRWRVRAQVGGEWMDWSVERTFDVEPLDADC